jgi:hypothetical protein
VKFRIPEASEAEEVAGATDSAAGSSKGLASGSGSAVAKGEQQIEFLCPNGHRLHGPASLQGRPGQCPECNSRFRIPSYDEVPDEDEEKPEEEIGVVSGDESKVTLEEEPGETEAGQESRYDLEEKEEGVTALQLDDSGSLATSGKLNHLAELVGKLWAEKTSDSVMELHLDGGETIVPTHFAKSASQRSHALFAVEEGSGHYRLLMVPWTAIQRIEIRGVKHLPEWMR